MGAALLALPLTVGQATVGHAAGAASACVTSMVWDIPNVIQPVRFSSSLDVWQVACGGADLGGAPPVSATTNENFDMMPYQYSGNCVEGTLVFDNGDVGLFSGGVLVIEGQGAGPIDAQVVHGDSLTVPCTGGLAQYSWLGGQVTAS